MSPLEHLPEHCKARSILRLSETGGGCSSRAGVEQWAHRGPRPLQRSIRKCGAAYAVARWNEFRVRTNSDRRPFLLPCPCPSTDRLPTEPHAAQGRLAVLGPHGLHIKLSDRAVALEKADVRGTNCLDKGSRTQAYGAHSSLSAERFHRSRSTQGDHRRDGAPRSQPGLAAQGALRLAAVRAGTTSGLCAQTLFTSSSRRLRPSIACVTSRVEPGVFVATQSRAAPAVWAFGCRGTGGAIPRLASNRLPMLRRQAAARISSAGPKNS
jgi:hypothetical protein